MSATPTGSSAPAASTNAAVGNVVGFGAVAAGLVAVVIGL